MEANTMSNAKPKRSDKDDTLTAMRHAADNAATRPCMSCGQKFESEGWHNRLCPQCRKRT
jgi:hypothetical protein